MKRFIAILLSLVLFVSVIPISAFAEETVPILIQNGDAEQDPGGEGELEDIVVLEPQEDPDPSDPGGTSDPGEPPDPGGSSDPSDPSGPSDPGGTGEPGEPGDPPDPPPPTEKIPETLPQSPPRAPTAVYVDKTACKVKAVPKDTTCVGQLVFSIDNGATWQEEPEFTGLNSGEVYDIIAKYLEVYDVTDKGTTYLKNSESPVSEVLEIVTVPEDTFLVSSEAELLAAIEEAKSLDAERINIRFRNSITVDQTVVLPLHPTGATFYFDLYGFTLSSSSGVDPVVEVHGETIMGSSWFVERHFEGLTESVKVHGGRLRAEGTAVTVAADGHLTMQEIDITSPTTLVNNGTVEKLYDCDFDGTLINNGTIVSVDGTVFNQIDDTLEIDNYGTIQELGGTFNSSKMVTTLIKNESTGVIEKMTSNVVDSAITATGSEPAPKDHIGLVCNEGTIKRLDADLKFWGIAGISNFGTIEEISGGTYTKSIEPYNADHPYGAPLVNQATGVIELISGGFFYSSKDSVINYGAIKEISEGKFGEFKGTGYHSNHIVRNFGTIEDVWGGTYYSPFVNDTDNGVTGTLEYRDGYGMSTTTHVWVNQSYNSGWNLAVGKKIHIKWEGLQNKDVFLFHNYGQAVTGYIYTNEQNVLNQQYENAGEIQIVDRYDGEYEADFIQGEEFSIYQFAGWSGAKNKDNGVVIVDSNYSYLLEYPSGNKVPRPYSAYDYSGLGYSKHLLLAYDAWHIPVVGGARYDYSNKSYFHLANIGWKDQDGKLYTGFRAGANSFYRVPDHDITLTEVDSVIEGSSAPAKYIQSYASSTDTEIKIGPSKNINQHMVSRYTNNIRPGYHPKIHPQYSLDGETWIDMPDPDGDEQYVTFSGLEPDTEYEVYCRLVVDACNEVTVIPSHEFSHKIKTAESTDFRPVVRYEDNVIYVTFSNGVRVWAASVSNTDTPHYPNKAFSDWSPFYGCYVVRSCPYTIDNSLGEWIYSYNPDIVCSSPVTFSVDLSKYNTSKDITKLTNWTIHYRREENGNWITRAAIIPLKVTQSPPETEIVRTGDNFLNIQEVPGGEYAIKINGVWSDWQTSTSFAGLSPDTEYEIRARYSETDVYQPGETFTVTGKTKQAQTQTPELPEVTRRTNDTIEITSIDGVEYSIDGGSTWQTSGLFENLLEGTEYVIIARIAETDDTYFGPTTPELVVETKRTTREAPEEPPVLKSVTVNTIIVETVEGIEYSIDDGETWQTDGVFEGLEQGTEYTVISRYAEDDDYMPSPVSEPLVVKTKVPVKNTSEYETHTAYIFGYPEGTVRPEGYMTRAEAAAVFSRVFPQELSMSRAQFYSDVNEGAWYYTSIQSLTAAGYLAGYSDGTFRPDDPITRAEFAALAVRFKEAVAAKARSSVYTDVTSSWAQGSITEATGAGWFVGYPDNTFRPENYITRAEVMSIVNRMRGRTPTLSEDVIEQLTLFPDCTDTSSWYFADVIEASITHEVEITADGVVCWVLPST